VETDVSLQLSFREGKFAQPIFLRCAQVPILIFWTSSIDGMTRKLFSIVLSILCADNQPVACLDWQEAWLRFDWLQSPALISLGPCSVSLCRCSYLLSNDEVWLSTEQEGQKWNIDWRLGPITATLQLSVLSLSLHLSTLTSCSPSLWCILWLYLVSSSMSRLCVFCVSQCVIEHSPLHVLFSHLIPLTAPSREIAKSLLSQRSHRWHFLSLLFSLLLGCLVILVLYCCLFLLWASFSVSLALHLNPMLSHASITNTYCSCIRILQWRLIWLVL